MKRLVFLLLFAAAWTTSQSFNGCADPMQNVNQSAAAPPASIHDTVSVVDTVVVVDTVIRIDTVIVVVPDTGTSTQLCAQIGPGQHEIVWILENQRGQYTLDFLAVVDRNQPVQTLRLDIDGTQFSWSPVKNPEFISTLQLSQHAIVRIMSNQPPAFGHPIDICLTVRHK